MMFLLFLLWGARAEECACTGTNKGLPNTSRHQGTPFGTYCSPWDKLYDRCIEDDPPKWCNEKWCYVKQGCTIEGKVDAKPSTYKNSGLFYSYRVCGSIDYFDEEDFEYVFEGCEGKERVEPLDVYFVVDSSASINPTEWKQQMSFLSKLTELGMTVEGDRVGVIQWSKDQWVEYTYANTLDEIMEGVHSLTQNKGGTKTSEALDFAMKQMTEVETPKNKMVMFLLTDGEPDVKSAPCGNRKDRNYKQQLADKKITLGILAIGNKDFRGTMGCLVDDPKEQIVIMQDFDHFYEYRDPTADQNLMCVDPNVFTDDLELPKCDDNSCGNKWRVRGKTSKKKDTAQRQAYVACSSCVCKRLCKDGNFEAFSFRTQKVKERKKSNRKACVCFNDLDEKDIKKENTNGNQLMGLVD